MVTVEVDLKEGDEQPEQHLDDGEHIERVVVPLSELYDKLQGKSDSVPECEGTMVTMLSPSAFERGWQDRGREVSACYTPSYPAACGGD